MEFPQIGQHCNSLNCKSLDFLPLQCKCSKLFCSDHFREHVEQCEQLNNVTENLQKINELYQCMQSGCTIKCIVPITCNKCKQHFCISHRHITSCVPADPNVVKLQKELAQIPVNQFQEAKETIDKLINENITKAKKKSKMQETAKKVQLMRLKNKAVGEKVIPTSDRIYFDIHYNKNNKASNVAIFVSKTWPLGKIIDVIAQECKLKNENNQANSLKLRLFSKENGNILSKDMAIKLEDILSRSQIFDGDSLLLTYVKNDCSTLN